MSPTPQADEAVDPLGTQLLVNRYQVSYCRQTGGLTYVTVINLAFLDPDNGILYKNQEPSYYLFDLIINQ